MDNQAQLQAMRELFLTAPESNVTSVLAIVISGLLVIAVLALVRTRRLTEEYTPIWMLAALGLLVISIWSGLITTLAHAIGAWTTSSTLFFLGEVFLVALCLNYAVRLSQSGLQIKNLAQEVALLRARLDALTDRPATPPPDSR